MALMSVEEAKQKPHQAIWQATAGSRITKAGIVLLNEAGITCDGCGEGFVYGQHAALSNGMPVHNTLGCLDRSRERSQAALAAEYGDFVFTDRHYEDARARIARLTERAADDYIYQRIMNRRGETGVQSERLTYLAYSVALRLIDEFIAREYGSPEPGGGQE